MEQQKTISIPWIIVDKKLLVSTPQGEVLDFPFEGSIEEKLDEMLSSTGLWEMFFKSLVASLNVQK